MVSSSSQSPSKVGISRRTVTTGLAWSVPAIVLAAPAVAAASSVCGPALRLMNTMIGATGDLGSSSRRFVDYVSYNCPLSLGGSERFYDYGVDYQDSTNYKLAPEVQSTDTDDFRYALRIQNVGECGVLDTNQYPIQIQFRYPRRADIYWNQYKSSFSSYPPPLSDFSTAGGQEVFRKLTLVDNIASTDVQGTPSWMVRLYSQDWSQFQVQTPGNDTDWYHVYSEQLPDGAKVEYQNVSLVVTGVTIPVGGWVQISADWLIDNAYLKWPWKQIKDSRAIPMNALAWLTDFRTITEQSNVVAPAATPNPTYPRQASGQGNQVDRDNVTGNFWDSSDTDSTTAFNEANTGWSDQWNTIQGAWVFDGGRERPYGASNSDQISGGNPDDTFVGAAPKESTQPTACSGFNLF